MTREDVEKLSGRELDAAVHERLYGITVKWGGHNGDVPMCGVSGLMISHYSTEEGPAFFAMLAAVREKGWVIEVDDADSGLWDVLLYPRRNDPDRAVRGIAPTLPLAFARAALLTTFTSCDHNL